MRDDKDADQYEAAVSLSWHCGKKYGPTLIDRVADKKRDLKTRGNYYWALLPAYYRGLEEKDKKRLIRVAFALLIEDKSYFTAGWTGSLIKVDICPNQDDPKYHKDAARNLNEAFFEDTVKKALAWWAVHEADYAEKAMPQGAVP